MTDDGNEYTDDPPETALDPPALIGIIGAGPVGLEAALYARFLGYEVIVWEQGEVADHVTNDHGKPTEFGNLTTPLGRNALAAQSAEYVPREPSAETSAQEWKTEYLLPLAKTDLIRKAIKTETTVGSVECITGAKVDGEDQQDSLFRIRAEDGSELATVASVIDTARDTPFLDAAEFNEDAIAAANRDSLPAALKTNVVNYYVLGAKSWGQRNADFTATIGHDQIRALFSIIGDRENLDLYPRT